MSKIPDNVLLIPGETGWEIWTGQPDSGYTLHRATDAEQASDVEDIPNGELLHFFPVKSVTAIPLRVTSDDEALFGDLSSLHAERLGMRTDPMAGQLTDTFIIAREPENSALLTVHLRAPSDADLPGRAVKGFDISARTRTLEGNQIAIWKEFGRWAFSAYAHGQLAYCQITTSSASSPDESLAREIRLALAQLSMQGIEIRPTRVHIWTSPENVDATNLPSLFGLPVDVLPRPAPYVPSPLSKLLPADVRSARKAAQRRQNVMLGIAAIGIIYVGLVGWLGYGLWKESSETKRILAKAEASAPEGAAYALHLQKWEELSDAIDLKNSPVDILNRIARNIPPNSGLRLRVADISSHEIALTGEAPQLESVNKLSLALTKSNDLAHFTWSTPEPTQRERGWEFQFKADIPTENQP